MRHVLYRIIGHIIDVVQGRSPYWHKVDALRGLTSLHRLFKRIFNPTLLVANLLLEDHSGLDSLRTHKFLNKRFGCLMSNEQSATDALKLLSELSN